MPDLAYYTPVLLLSSAIATAAAGDFAAHVLDYAPAPGQFVNNTSFNDPARALGAPVGGGTISADNTSIVTLGGFGGSITLAFDEPVFDDPCNPFGLDAIVFGNAFWVLENPQRRFAEAATIEISRDDNANGIADDAWYLIRGSSLGDMPIDDFETREWDNIPGNALPPSNVAWFPLGAMSPLLTGAFRLAALEISILNNGGAMTENFFGYGELSPVLVLGDIDADNAVEDPLADPAEFYTNPDNPREVGITTGSGGGDAFDIAWAVDPLTGERAPIDAFDFIRITTAVDFIAGPLGELSAEIDAVSDVRAQPTFYEIDDKTGVDLEDLYAWFHANQRDLNGDLLIDAQDTRALARCVRAHEPDDVLQGGDP
ncbi:MAG: hypothetical protein AAGD00_03155 [Planctomycetota bacterium]